MNDFESGIVKSAIDFLFGKPLSITVNHFDLLKFAFTYAYAILDLLVNIFILNAAKQIKKINFQKECCDFVERSADGFFESPKFDVCEYIQIAYTHYLKKLNRKCSKILFENRKEIDALKLNNLLKNILVDVLRY